MVAVLFLGEGVYVFVRSDKDEDVFGLDYGVCAWQVVDFLLEAVLVGDALEVIPAIKKELGNT